ncbi:MAG: tRNA ((37)-N6)-threonylcarbamoyltransferase complex ATPase subunit type 1 TsaE [Candidatus Binatus sp.]|jgi:tRNA threonylcarbamoyladenosine biosynthesis protein TsaE|nr:tRNA ((37)-N6)-threonylcarbamoyltransferase complex ATPase subunit type 1 TsaE [Candidatus Binatus sp.]
MANANIDSDAGAVTLVIESRSAHETKSWGRRLASLLEGGELIGFIGELGAGKTCFIKGLARGLNLREEDILSPTFTMIQEHHGRFPLYHIDLYRLEEATLDDMGLREYLFSSGVAAVEWFERLHEFEDLDYLSVRISYAGANYRRIEFSASGAHHADVIGRLKRFA